MSLRCQTLFFLADEEQEPLVKLNGKVQYSVMLTTGASDIPTGSNLTLTTSGTNTPDVDLFSDAVCKSADQTEVMLGQLLPDECTNASSAWNCTFSITVTEAHQQAGKIGQFNVSFGYIDSLGGQLSPAYFIPKATTHDVPVYAGAYLTYQEYEVVPGPYMIDGRFLLRRSKLHPQQYKLLAVLLGLYDEMAGCSAFVPDSIKDHDTGWAVRRPGKEPFYITVLLAASVHLQH